ncbi:MFS transporter [Cuniculiplasma sp. SKW4]|uniref:MFS transporter n=1 Tax=Cuniculiplasma sp. SKW4 TaxID=3400171 RepID=UPI003FD4D23C
MSIISKWSAVLRERNYLLILSASADSLFGGGIGNVTILWLAYASTKSALVVALVGVTLYLSRSASSFLFTSLIDRWSRKKLMIMSDLGRSAGLAIIILGSTVFGFNLFLLLIGVTVISMFFSSFVPASRAIIPTIVRNETLANATGLLGSTEQASAMLGSIVGGALIAFYGTSIPLEVNIATYMISAMILSFIAEPGRMKNVDVQPKNEPKFWQQFREGLRYIMQNRGLLLLLGFSLIVNFFIASYQNFIVVFSTSALHASSFYYGLIVGGASAGGIIGGLAVSHLKTDISFGFWTAVSAISVGAAVLIIALMNNLIISVLAFSIIGFLLALAVVSEMSGLQRIVPHDFLGRVLTIDQGFSYIMSPAGMIAGWILISFLGIRYDYLISGTGIAVVGALMVVLPSVRRIK